jgi:hypothetical protein
MSGVRCVQAQSPPDVGEGHGFVLEIPRHVVFGVEELDGVGTELAFESLSTHIGDRPGLMSAKNYCETYDDGTHGVGCVAVRTAEGVASLVGSTHETSAYDVSAGLPGAGVTI